MLCTGHRNEKGMRGEPAPYHSPVLVGLPGPNSPRLLYQPLPNEDWYSAADSARTG